MVKIKPFAALTYNYKHKGCQPQEVVCPPYDIITSNEAGFYRHLSPHNMIHFTLPVETKGRNRYQAAASGFNNCLDKGILRRDEQPAMYIYQQEFRVGPENNFSGNKHGEFRRLGFIACLNLNSSSSIHGHEHTHIEPKEDRFKLLAEVKANLEPVFMLFSDPQGSIDGIIKRYIQGKKPFIRFRGRDKSVNSLWRLDQPDILGTIKKKMSSKK